MPAIQHIFAIFQMSINGECMCIHTPYMKSHGPCDQEHYTHDNNVDTTPIMTQPMMKN